ncbi:unnamed protein product, partial [Staurois parvus]
MTRELQTVQGMTRDCGHSALNDQRLRTVQGMTRELQTTVQGMTRDC